MFGDVRGAEALVERYILAKALRIKPYSRREIGGVHRPIELGVRGENSQE
ncbi:unnamed protein product [marine sediment metagenome]|uniref:Uncharacterized protein n=1 Tax=marine sediment metagenome TaxID=412755 RepID=X0TI68_9ZZZZ